MAQRLLPHELRSPAHKTVSREFPSPDRKNAHEAASDALSAFAEQVRGDAAVYREEQAEELAGEAREPLS